jgi:NitT/TauT family transport system permease protein
LNAPAPPGAAGEPSGGGPKPAGEAPAAPPASLPPSPAPAQPAAAAPGPGAPARAGARLLAELRRWAVIRDRPGTWGTAAAALFCVGLVLLVWQVCTAGDTVEERLVGPMILPSLAETFGSFKALWFERAVARSALWSLGRVLGGFLLAAAVGVPLGVTAATFRRLYAFFNPLSIFGRNVPIAALIPLTLIWFGVGEIQKVMFIFLAAVAFIFFDAARAVDDVPDSYLDSAYTLGARFVPRHGALWSAAIGAAYALVFAAGYWAMAGGPAPAEAGGGAAAGGVLAAWSWRLALAAGAGFALGFLLWFPVMSFQAVRKVLFALAMPNIVNSLRLLFGLAFGYIMLAEVINAEYGLGSIIELSRRQGPGEHIYLVLVLITLLAFGIDRLILLAQRWLFPYRRAEGH